MPRRKRKRSLSQEIVASMQVDETMEMEEGVGEGWSGAFTPGELDDEGVYVKCPSCGTVVEVSLESPECPVCAEDLYDEVLAVMRGDEDERMGSMSISDDEEEF